MTDVMRISSFTTTGSIGILPWERQLRQKLSFDIEYPVDCKQASSEDDIADTVDYAQLSDAIIDFLANQHFGLLETLAEQLSQHLLSQFSLAWVRLHICKIGAIKQARHVEISIERAKNA